MSTVAVSPGGTIGEVIGTWGGRIIGGAAGELFGPEAVPVGAYLGGKAGAYVGRAAGEYVASHMSNANEKADQKSKAGNPTQACSDCKPLGNRHNPCKVKTNNPTKDQNTMIDPSCKTQVDSEINSIINGNVPRTGDTWTVSGRTYGLHNNAIYPQSGPGLVELPNRLQHQLLGQLNSNSYENAMKFADNLKSKGLMSEKEFQDVMKLWNKCPKNTS